jgi:hypothetical protein
MGYGKKGMGGAHPILKHMRPSGGGTGTKQSMSKNADIKYGGSVIDQFKSPMNIGIGSAVTGIKAGMTIAKGVKDAFNKYVKVGGVSGDDKKKQAIRNAELKKKRLAKIAAKKAG